VSAYVLDPSPYNDDFRLTALRRPPKLSKGIDATLERLRGRLKGGRRVLERILTRARAVDDASREHGALSDQELRKRLASMREVFRRGGAGASASLDEALGLVQEAVQRTLAFRPYPVQIAGALALEDGFIAEMSTGEGKTVTIAMSAVLRGWSGLPCHVLTANDYLAGRDAKLMEPLFRFCDVTVGSVTSGMEPAERRLGYAKDVTYTTAGDVLADFLRDRIALDQGQNYQRRCIDAAFDPRRKSTDGVVMRGIHTAIVDEADNILVDEAVTPLIISRREPNEPFSMACHIASRIAARLVRDVHYEVDDRFRIVRFTRSLDAADSTSEGEAGIFAGSSFRNDLVKQALVAREFFHRDKQYIVEDGKVIIVDESTGRKMPMRTWNAGLHQMIELKEGLETSPMQETQARMSFQRFFRFYRKFSGMTGTGKEAAGEFWHVYGVPVLTIPNNRPSRRTILPLRSFATAEEKWRSIVEEVADIHATGRPVLVGTRSVAASESLAARLEARGLACQIVNANRQEEEAETIAVAGRLGAITVATNMAGRGTDIRIPADVEVLGGLHVIATEPHRSSRIDRQLFGRGARQGDRGSASMSVSLEDELLVLNLPSTFLRLVSSLRRIHPRTADAVASFAVATAQHFAQRKDALSRLAVQQSDTWLDESLSFSKDDVN
jgi:preprotein translocase subunit SecA